MKIKSRLVAKVVVTTAILSLSLTGIVFADNKESSIDNSLYGLL